ncbi:hypothetical protein PG911_14640 [Tenacibaculum ovolyticum]|uniref:hypothetical protein n=1 Tax=Tenacibaculum ovolyticum TaxID=104270 RepID=UPI0022F391E0|nr:hypothetical protein [Tenacibaculum ovolyticum]WBX75874.1 hypothetical protein PG911_14640 [Tenacibaculum ovolyticum]
MIRVIIFIIICSFNIIASFGKVKPEKIKKNTNATIIIINNNKDFRILKKEYNKSEKSEKLIKTVITFVKK